jgi:hypothetical protein
MTDQKLDQTPPETDRDEDDTAALTKPKPRVAQAGVEPAAPATGGAGSAGAGGPKGFGTGS